MTLLRSPRFLTTLAVSACLVGAALVGAQPSVAATKACSTPSYPGGDGNGYFTRLRATNVSCRSARRLVTAYYRCRVRAGGRRGSCNGRTVNNLRCTERRGAAIATQFNATVTCKRGSKKVVHSYQQNLGE